MCNLQDKDDGAGGDDIESLRRKALSGGMFFHKAQLELDPAPNE